MCCGVVDGLRGKRNNRLRRQNLTWSNSPGAEFAAEAWELHELTDCATDAPAKDELIL